MAAELVAVFASGVAPTLPHVGFADTETVTNVPFAAWTENLREFRFELDFTGTASNNVEMAFGTDVDGDGRLSDGEVSTSAGWDCGEWFVFDSASGARTAASAPDGRHVFSCVCEMRSSGEIVGVAFFDNGAPVFADLAASTPSWLHSPDWNMVRLVGRGENVRAGERFSAKVTSGQTLFILR